MEMEFDWKQAALKEGEETIKRVFKNIVRPLATELIIKSENKIDDIALPFFDQLEAALFQLVDKIDGVEGN